MFSIFKRKKEFRPEIVFGHDALPHGEHGRLIATNVKLGIHQRDVPFAFVGMVTPPLLTLDNMVYLFEKAKDAGYIPLVLKEYGKAAEMVKTITELNEAVEHGNSVIPLSGMHRV